jgi:hypothetical protein
MNNKLIPFPNNYYSCLPGVLETATFIVVATIHISSQTHTHISCLITHTHTHSSPWNIVLTKQGTQVDRHTIRHFHTQAGHFHLTSFTLDILPDFPITNY